MALSDAYSARKLGLSHVEAPEFSDSSADCAQINSSLVSRFFG
jgi:hypothetical protein